MLKAVWKDPVWSKVIATAVVAIAIAAGTYLLNVWPTIARVGTDVWQRAGEPSQLANWIVWLAFVVSVPTIALVLALAWSAVRPDATASDWKSYTEDRFVGLRWRWGYSSNGGMNDPVPFCPHCDFQVMPHRASAYEAIDRIGFKCEACSASLPTFDESFDSLRSRVTRLAQQKLRNGVNRPGIAGGSIW